MRIIIIGYITVLAYGLFLYFQCPTSVQMHEVKDSRWSQYYFVGTSGACYYIVESYKTIHSISELKSCNDTLNIEEE